MLDTLRAAATGPGGILPAVTNVAREDDVAASYALAARKLGGLDAVVANAGGQPAGGDDRAVRLSLGLWRETIDINVTGMFLTTKYGTQALLKRGGAIAMTLCPTGFHGCAPGYTAYSASEDGVAGLMRVLAADYAPHGIRVNGVVPGYTPRR